MGAPTDDRPDEPVTAAVDIADTLDAERLDDLEAAESKRVESKRLDRKFELIEAILLSIAAVLAAWAGFQSAKWSGVQANSYSLASASRVESTRQSTLAGQQSTVDVITFTEWLQAAQGDGLFDQAAAPNQHYQPDPSRLSGFLYERFRPEFKVAVDAWIATNPRVNVDAPATPFVMPEYRLATRQQASRLENQAEAQSADARTTNQRSDNYVLMTIMFATVLFFAGISSKMDTFRHRVFLLGAATALLVASTIVVVAFPKNV